MTTLHIEAAHGLSLQQRCPPIGALLLLAISVLSGCGSSKAPADVSKTPPVAVQSPCFEDCNKQLILDLPQIENQHFTDAGRYFLSGQINFYEVTRAADGHLQSHAYFADGQGCSGMASDGLSLWVLCPSPSSSTAPSNGTSIYRLDLTKADAQPVAIFALTGMSLPNGMALGPDRHLYITDGPVASEPKIVRVQLDPQNPDRALRQQTWVLTMPQYPNGLALRGRQFFTTLYGADRGTVARIELMADGTAGPITTFYQRGHIMDDLSVQADNLLVAEFETGRIFQVGANGALLHETPAATFSQPSSVLLGRPPLFTGNEILVTQRYSGSGVTALTAKQH